MSQQAASRVPEITEGKWAVKESQDGDPELFYRGHDVVPCVTSAELTKASLDLMKLAKALSAAGF